MDDSLQLRLQTLGDLGLALLVSMFAQEHCILSTVTGSTQSLQDELRSTCRERFGLQPVVVECSTKTTVDEFNEALLVDNEPEAEDGYEARDRTGSSLPPGQRNPGRFGSLAMMGDRRIADVIIASNLDIASDSVQVQALELLSNKRIFTRSAMHVAPKDLLFLVVLSRPGARLFRHLNDLFCMSHVHDEDDEMLHMDQANGQETAPPVIWPEDIHHLRKLMDSVILTAEIAQYLHNVVVFMRNSRYIKGGVTAAATRQLRSLSRALAPLHGMDYVPPSLVALAARKIYAHRLILATAENEKSLLWGSDTAAVKELLEGMTVEDVIEDVLASLEAPL